MKWNLFCFCFIFLLLLSLAPGVHARGYNIATTKDEITGTPRTTSRLEKIAEFRARVEARREEIKTKFESRREALKEKLDEFKDRRKAQIAERVSTNLNAINDHRVEMMLHNLTRMEELLGKVKDKVAEKGAGKDVSSINTAIASAQTAIDIAKTALEAQAGKDYTLTVTDESKIRSDAQGVRDQLHSDLNGVHQKVVDARKAVANAIRAAYSVLGKQNVDEGETTGTPAAATPTLSATPVMTLTVTPSLTPTPGI